MKTILALFALGALALAQSPGGPQQRGHQAQPSIPVTTPIPARTVTITFPASSDLLTAIESDRINHYKLAVDANNNVSLQAIDPTIEAHILTMLQESYFKAALYKYPSAAVKAHQANAAKEQQAAADTAKQAATVTADPAPVTAK